MIIFFCYICLPNKFIHTKKNFLLHQMDSSTSNEISRCQMCQKKGEDFLACPKCFRLFCPLCIEVRYLITIRTYQRRMIIFGALIVKI